MANPMPVESSTALQEKNVERGLYGMKDKGTFVEGGVVTAMTDEQYEVKSKMEKEFIEKDGLTPQEASVKAQEEFKGKNKMKIIEPRNPSKTQANKMEDE